MLKQVPTNTPQNIARIVLGCFMVFAGTGHLTWLRTEFVAQVPNWLPLGKDFVVVASGVVEVALGLAMLFWKGQRVWVGIALATFYVLIFPGNISQYINHVDAFGLDTDKARLIRLFFQPVLVVLALWSTGAISALRKRNNP